ncbi:RNA-binding S4 domain-containing protein [Alicyclobacillus contaminans]|uniref:RNA-binding S4 domain-containing protein n=1 Tax=Alicyclobacillus contaminans TaxID=392016 RepID=UPI0003FDE02A|nr:RNA-binding S4 domain-containing protein [Alicyclobacillus contaminans]GMA50523.1 RNA-binding S4 domain-containing protein [Alicyclobacillus contaminans]
MRLDKFLKSSRLIKRRTVAKEVSDAGRILINDKVAKPGSEVKVGDVLTIHYGQRTVQARVLQLLENPRKDQAESMYEWLGDGRGLEEGPET